jgi:hypothetical protein
MPHGDHTTLTAVTAPTVLTLGCSSDLRARCAAALVSIGAILKHTDLAGAVTYVAERQPLVIVMPDDLYAFDPEEFDALARDVRASLLRVDEDIAEAMLELLLGAAIDAAIFRRRKEGAIIVGVDRAPPSRRGPPSGRATVRRPSWSDLEAAPPSSQGRL